MKALAWAGYLGDGVGMDWGPTKAGGWVVCWRGDHRVRERDGGGLDLGRGSRVGKKAGSETQQEWRLDVGGEDGSKVVLGFPA